MESLTYENPGTSMDTLLDPGTIVGKAKILSELGGEWSRNKKAVDLKTGKTVVLKLGSKFASSDGKTSVEAANFMMWNNICHLTRIAPGPDSNIVGILGHGKIDYCLVEIQGKGKKALGGIYKYKGKKYQKLYFGGTALYSLHPHIDGASGEELTTGDKNLKSLVRIVTTAAKALLELTNNNTLHRDIKPDNLLVDNDGRARIFDLGIALQLDKKTKYVKPMGNKHVETIGKSGTPGYMSPEQVDAICKPTIFGPESDIFSLGLTYYEIITGKMAVKGGKELDENSTSNERKDFSWEQVDNVAAGNVSARKYPITIARPDLLDAVRTKEEGKVLKELESLILMMISHHASDRPEINFIVDQLKNMEFRLGFA